MVNLSGIFALIVTLAVGGGFIYMSLSAMTTASAMKNWPTTNGTILYSNVTSQTNYVTHGNGGGSYQTMYSPSVEYSYLVNGQTYKSGSISQFGFSSSLSYIAEQEAAKYPVGNTVSVYYNPSNPYQSYLERSSGIVSGGLIFLIIGIVILIGGVILSLRILFSSGVP